MKKSLYSKDQQFLVSRLKKARQAAGFDQKQAAKRLGRTQSYISKLESGQRRVDVIQLKEIARTYRKKIDYFIP
jgi:transcriptional regulator with XRE-family HTH domain